MLKFYYANETDVPADEKKYYEQRAAEGNNQAGWYLKVEGAVHRSKLEEFRNGNHELSDKVTRLEADLKKFENVDPEKFFRLQDREQEIMDEKLVKAGKLEEVVAQRTEGMKNEHARQVEAKDKAIKTLTEERDSARSQLAIVKIDNVLMSEAQKHGIESGAEQFLLAAAHNEWKLDDNGNPVCFDKDGKKRYGKDGDLMRPGEWMDDLHRNNKFMFKNNVGSGAQGGTGSGGGDGEVNWWKDETWSTKEQMMLRNKDPEKADRMMKAAGKVLGQGPKQQNSGRPNIIPVGIPGAPALGGVVR